MKYPINGIYLINGLTESGKTTLLNYLAYQMRNEFDYAIGFTSTRFRHTLHFLRDEFVYEDFRPDVIEKIMEKQVKLIKGGTEAHVAIFLDDVLGSDSLSLYGPLWKKLASSCRHYNMTIFIATQYVNAIAPIIRRNAKMLFFTSSVPEAELQVIFKEFGRLLNRETLRKILDQGTRGFSAVQINPHAINQQTMYTTITAPKDLPKFTIG